MAYLEEDRKGSVQATEGDWKVKKGKGRGRGTRPILGHRAGQGVGGLGEVVTLGSGMRRFRAGMRFA
jgi:hypothetical protein